MNSLFQGAAPTLALLGLSGALLVAAAVLGGRRAFGGDDLMRFTLRAAGYMLAASACAAFLIWTLGPPALALIGLAAVIAGIVLAESRLNKRRALGPLLAAAARRGMPLAPAVEALADEIPGRVANRLHALAQRLRAGEPLPEALATTPGACEPMLPAAAAIGETSGCLEPALRVAAAGQRTYQKTASELTGGLWYAVLALLLSVYPLSFNALFLMPRFRRIYYDFEVELDPSSKAVYALLESPTFLWAFGLFLLVLFVLAMALIASLVWNPASPWPLRRLLWRLQFRGGLELLSLAAERQTPLPKAMNRIADFTASRRLRHRLRAAANDMGRGAAFEDSLERQGLVSAAQAGILRAAARVGNLPWALREIALTIGRREARRIQIVVNGMTWALFGIVAASLILTALSTFVPLVKVIRSLT